MTTNETAMPPVVSSDAWLAARKAHLLEEKQLTRQADQLHAQRRRLPMVKLDKEYSFDGPEGKRTLGDLFEGQRQLIVYHFMFDPQWDKGCSGCTGFVDALGDLSMLSERNTSFVLISRAPLAKLEQYKQSKGWEYPWFSSFGSDFNYDFHVTLDDAIAPMQHNFVDNQEHQAKTGSPYSKGEAQGLSVFFRDGDDIFHTYSSYARGVENLTNSYTLLDTTPYGRQEDWEDSPPHWPQKPTYG